MNHLHSGSHGMYWKRSKKCIGSMRAPTSSPIKSKAWAGKSFTGHLLFGEIFGVQNGDKYGHLRSKMRILCRRHRCLLWTGGTITRARIRKEAIPATAIYWRWPAIWTSKQLHALQWFFAIACMLCGPLNKADLARVMPEYFLAK